MVATDAGTALDRISGALARALSDATGANIDLVAAVLTPQAEALSALGDGAKIHLELDVLIGRSPAYPLVIAAAAADLMPVLGLSDPGEAAVPPDSEGQLALLGALTDSAESVASGLSTALSARGAPATVRVSGTSLENGGDAQQPPSLLPGDAVSYLLTLRLSNGESFALLAIAAAVLVAALNSPAIAESGNSLRVEPEASFGQVPSAPPSDDGPSRARAHGAQTAHPFMFGQLEPGGGILNPHERGLDPILDVPLHLRVELGATEMLVEDVLGIGIGSVIELNRLAGEPLDVVVNNRLIARGEVVVVDESFGVRITEVVRPRIRPSLGLTP